MVENTVMYEGNGKIGAFANEVYGVVASQRISSYGFPIFSAYFITDNVPFIAARLVSSTPLRHNPLIA